MTGPLESSRTASATRIITGSDNVNPRVPAARSKARFNMSFHLDRRNPSEKTNQLGFTARSATRPVKPESAVAASSTRNRSEEHTSELQSLRHLVCRLLL